MRPDDLRRLLAGQPFCPFRVFVSDGATYDITHPEIGTVVHMSLRIALRPGSVLDSRQQRFALVSVIHITRVEVYYPLGSPSPE
jgi:hypothetical protein